MTQPLVVDAQVFEVLTEFGLAHLRAADGRVLGVNRDTPGIKFGDLREGQCLRCAVAQPFARVLHAKLISGEL